MPTVYVNDQPVEIGSERLNCVQVAEKAGLLVPHYCYHPALTVVASCRMCLVEVGDLKDGKVMMQPKVLPGCQTPVKDGTVIVTGDYDKRDTLFQKLPYDEKYVPGDRAKKAQADTLEGLLLNHPLDCPVCDKAGECKLQDYSFQFGRSQSRMVDEKNQPPNKPEISSKISLFTDRCIMCSRCVRFTREIAGTAELTVINRGHHAEIDVFPGAPLENKLAGNVVDLCPVGALGSKDFLYTQRVWYLKETDSVCPGCSTGCSVKLDTNKDVLFRLQARENHQAQGYFMCDEGRYGYHYINSPDRLGRPFMRSSETLKPTTWNQVIPEIRKEFQSEVQKHPHDVWVILSPFLTCEEAFLLSKWAKNLSSGIRLALGPVPVVGQDDTFPKDRRGNPTSTVKFTIRAEKAPNRRGVEEVLKHFTGGVTPFESLLNDAHHHNAKALFLTGGYPFRDWLSASEAEALAKIPLIVTTDLFSNLAAKTARFVLPSASFSEKDGTYVNFAGLAQTIQKASKSPNEARSEAQMFSELLDRRGLYQNNKVREEMSSEIPFFAPIRSGTGELGVKL
jgi:NADH-quinone oxidoreductase subunit G